MAVVVKNPAFQCRRHKRPWFDPWVGKISWRREWQPTPVFLPGESHGQRSLVGYSPWGSKEPDTIERAYTWFRGEVNTLKLDLRSDWIWTLGNQWMYHQWDMNIDLSLSSTGNLLLLCRIRLHLFIYISFRVWVHLQDGNCMWLKLPLITLSQIIQLFYLRVKILFYTTLLQLQVPQGHCSLNMPNPIQSFLLPICFSICLQDAFSCYLHVTLLLH